MHAKVRCDDIAHNIYVDGKLIGNTTDWSEVWKKDISDDAKIIAVECENTVGLGGLIASISNGLTTDNTWKCSGGSVPGWYDVDFDDSEWERAHVVKLNGDRQQLWNPDINFPDHAVWIWKDNSRNERSYCRGILRK